MSDSIINIILNTVKKGGGDKEALTGLKKLSSGFKELTGFNLGAVSAVGAVSMALGKMNQIAKESIQTTVELGNQTESLNQITGDTAETTSRFIQMVDDQRITFESLQRAMNAAAKKGYDVSTASIAKMSEEFRGLKTEQEQNLYLTDHFGKSGLEMERVLKLGSAAIYQKMGAVSDSIVMDDKAVKANIEYQESLDAWNDSIAGAKNSLGKELIPIISDYALVMGNLIEKMNKATPAQANWTKSLYALGVVGGIVNGIKALNETMNRSAEKLRDETKAAELAAFKMQDFKTAARETSDYLENGLNPAIDSAARQWGSLAMQEEYAASQAIDAKGDMVETAEAITQSLIDINNVDISFGDKIKGEIEKLNWLQAGGGEIQRLGESIDKALTDHKITPDQAEAMYSGLFLQNEALKLQQGENKDALVKDIVETFGVTQTEASNMLGDVYKDYDNRLLHWQVIIDTVSSGGGTAPIISAGPDDWINQPGSGYASGVDFTVPAGYPNDSYPMRVESGEHVTVTPAGQSSNESNVTINISGAGDAKAVAREVMRELKLQGVGR